jgi:hypothetical protein
LASVGAGVKVNEPPEPPDEEPEPDDEPKLGAKGLRMPNPPPGVPVAATRVSTAASAITNSSKLGHRSH